MANSTQTPVMKTEFFAITHTNQFIVNPVDGCIGTSPLHLDSSKYRLMTQLYENNLIDHLVFSIYTNKDLKKSYVKFGSMDKHAFDRNISVISTLNEKEWTLKVSDVDL